MSPYNETSSEAWKGLLLVVGLVALVVFQQSYAQSHEYGVEQPVGYLGMAEYLFRHPEKLLGL